MSSSQGVVNVRFFSLIIMSFSNILYEGKENKFEMLSKENEYLKAQIEAITREKSMHISQHAQEKENMQQHLRQLQERMVFERIRYRKDIMELTSQLQLLRNSVNKMIEMRNDRSESNKGKGKIQQETRGHQFSLAYKNEE